MTAASKETVVALIRENECIGCTKCIQVCPVDAILGSAKKMHTVLAQECIGCKLCLPPCPVDCIDLIFSNEKTEATPDLRKQKTEQIKKRFAARQKRLQRQHEQQYPNLVQTLNPEEPSLQDKRKKYIQQAVARMKLKKGLSNKTKEDSHENDR